MCTFVVGSIASSMEEHYDDSRFTTSMSNVPTSVSGFLPSVYVTVGLGFSYSGLINANVSGDIYPQRPVRISVDRLNYLSSVYRLPYETDNMVINTYISVVPQRLPKANLVQLVAYMLQDGLSTVELDVNWQCMLQICPTSGRMLEVIYDDCPSEWANHL